MSPTGARSRVPVRVVVGLFLASLALRPQLLAIGPLLPLIRDDLALSATAAGLLTTIPVFCMGLFAPIGPVISARLGPRTALMACLALLIGSGLARAAAPTYALVLLTTLGVGLGIGISGAIPSMMVSRRVSTRPALGTGAYAGGIVAGSTITAATVVPLAVDGDWRRALAIVSAVSVISIGALLLLIPADRSSDRGIARAPHLPWRNATAWILVALFGLQSLLYYGIIAWLPNAFVERGWSAVEAGSLIAVFNGIGLITTVGVPLVADRFGGRRQQLLMMGLISIATMGALVVVPEYAFVWIALLGLALGAIFTLVLTLPLDVASDPAQVGAVAALMLLGGYLVSATGPFVLGAARDLTGNFEVSLWLLVAIAVGFAACCLLLSADRLRAGIRRTAPQVAARS
jgi:CP family cyanate transporter-like MFS transporter